VAQKNSTSSSGRLTLPSEKANSGSTSSPKRKKKKVRSGGGKKFVEVTISGLPGFAAIAIRHGKFSKEEKEDGRLHLMKKERLLWEWGNRL